MSGYAWDAKAMRYVLIGTGEALQPTEVYGGISAMASAAADEMAGYSARLRAGRLSTEEWSRSMLDAIKRSHLAAAMVARGGREQMTQSDWGFAGRRIRQQYDFLRNFARQVAGGQVPLEGTALDARARLYGGAARALFQEATTREAKRQGFEIERNMLDEAADNCDECPALSDQGWVPIGTLPPVGTRECLTNCKCAIEQGRADEEAA